LEYSAILLCYTILQSLLQVTLETAKYYKN
jgi:hypothetical protein